MPELNVLEDEVHVFPVVEMADACEPPVGVEVINVVVRESKYFLAFF